MIPNKIKNKLKNHSQKIKDTFGEKKHKSIESGDISRQELAEITIVICGRDKENPMLKGE